MKTPSWRILLLAILSATLSWTQTVVAQNAESRREIVNASVVGILGGSPGGTYNKLVHDLAILLDDEYKLRILPTTGKGSVRGVEDLMYLRGIDVALVQSDVLDFYRTADVIPDIEKRLRYITKLYDEELHLIARRNIQSVGDLRGKRVNFGAPSSGTHMTSRLIFEQLGIPVEIQADQNKVAFQKLLNGEIDAMIRVVGKPMDAIADLPKNSGIHLVPIPSDRVQGAYVPTSFVSKDYPNIIVPGRSVETIAVGAVMAVYNWPADHPRRRKVENFVARFDQNFNQLLEPPFHSKWQEVNRNIEVPGWQRFTLSGTQ